MYLLPALIIVAIVLVCVVSDFEKSPSGERSGFDYVLLGVLIVVFAVINAFYEGAVGTVDFARYDSFDWSWYSYPSGK